MKKMKMWAILMLLAAQLVMLPATETLDVKASDDYAVLEEDYCPPLPEVTRTDKNIESEEPSCPPPSEEAKETEIPTTTEMPNDAADDSAELEEDYCPPLPEVTPTDENIEAEEPVSLPRMEITLTEETVQTLTLSTGNTSIKKEQTVKSKEKKENARKKVVYSSADNSVATVNKKGVITTKKAGTTVITVKSGKNVEKVKITVPKNIVINKGQKYSVKSLVGSQKTTFHSSNTKVASVTKKGKVKAGRKGTAVITVKCGKIKVKYRFKVK